MKTSELTGAALDWAVATCEGFTEYDPATEKMLPPRKEYGWVPLCDYNWSTDWSQGGPIIEREKIALMHIPDRLPHQQWAAGEMGETSAEFWEVVCGPTPLIAAMRCYVASKLGDEVDVPEELK